MRAVQIERFGGPDVLRSSTSWPEPGRRGPRRGLAPASTSPTRTSARTRLSRYEVPLVLGGRRWRRHADGRRVVALLRSGGYAEFAAAHEATVFPIPDGVTTERRSP